LFRSAGLSFYCDPDVEFHFRGHSLPSFSHISIALAVGHVPLMWGQMSFCFKINLNLIIFIFVDEFYEFIIGDKGIFDVFEYVFLAHLETCSKICDNHIIGQFFELTYWARFAGDHMVFIAFIGVE
jgi:hypothetical protein